MTTLKSLKLSRRGESRISLIPSIIIHFCSLQYKFLFHISISGPLVLGPCRLSWLDLRLCKTNKDEDWNAIKHFYISLKFAITNFHLCFQVKVINLSFYGIW